MTNQQTAIEASKGQRPFAVGTLFRAWHFRVLLVLICGGAGLLSVILGTDNYWDLRYYHLYAPWAYLHDRYLYDVGPAQEQGFLNPTADFLFYGLISSPLNETPRIVAFIMGAVHGVNAALIFAIACHVLQSPERWTLRAAAWLMGVSGAGFVSLLGTTSNDLTSSLFVLGSLLGILKVAEPPSERGTRADFDRLGSLVGWAKARSCAPCPPGRGLWWARGACHRAGQRPDPVALPTLRRFHTTETRFSRMWLGFAGAGLWAGIGVGLKYTSAVYIPGLGAVALLAAVRRKTVGGLIAFGVAALLGLLAVTGHHMLALWHAFGNPTFPYLNQIFQSPYWEPEAVRDARFLPHDFWQLMTYPFYWTITDTYVVAEPPFRDWRGAIAYVAMAAGFVACAASCIRNGYHGRLDGKSAQTRGLDLVFTFVVVSYFCWALGFGYYRYAVPLEMLTGVVTMGAVVWLFEDGRLRVAVAIMLVTLAASTTVYLDWGRGRYGDRYVDVHVPPLPANSVVLIATWDPVAFFIPFAEPRAQYLGIENNYLELSQNNILASTVKRIMRTPGRPKFILNVDEFSSNKLNSLLGQFGLRLSALPCQPIRTNLEGPALSLCPVADD
jgi:hypothetical protein